LKEVIQLHFTKKEDNKK